MGNETQNEYWQRIAGSLIDLVHLTPLDDVNEEMADALKRYFDTFKRPTFWPCRDGFHESCARRKQIECACDCHKEQASNAK